MKTDRSLIDGAMAGLMGLAGGLFLAAVALGLVPAWVPAAAALVFIGVVLQSVRD